ncbi:MAG TPA: CHAP domain-containing protein [Ktedonobacterales bacterium]
MLRSDVLWRNGGRLLSVALLGGLALNAGGAPIETMDAHGQSHTSLTWLTLENGWLCRSWSAPLAASATGISPVVMGSTANTIPLAFTTQRPGATAGADFAPSVQAVDSLVSVSRGIQRNVKHCTTQWHISADGHLISDATTWAPNPTGEWPALSEATLATAPLRASSRMLTLAGATHKAAPSKIASVLVMHTIAPKPVVLAAAAAPQSAPVYTAPGAIGPWTPVAGHPTYSMGDFAGDPHSSEFGVCTWWAWYARRDEPQLGTLGVATNWINNARAQGMSTGYAPAAGATVVFQPGVEGAGGNGHVAHVEQLLGGGWFIISEMNFYWNGGGWGRVDYRYAHAGSGVAFIY